MRVLVAGGAGFIGSHVIRALLAEGHAVTCLDNLLTGSAENLRGLDDEPHFEFISGSVEQAPRVPADAILHLASPASPVDYDRLPLETLAANSTGTWRLVEIARTTGASLTFVSTSEVYGDPLVHPQPESYWGNVDPIGPRACYDEAKRFGEALLMSARRQYGIRGNIVRFFNTYGPRMRLDDGRVVPELLGQAMRREPLTLHGDGLQTRSFCYVDDLVAGLLHVVLDGDADGEVYNIGNPHEVTVAELASTILRIAWPAGSVRFVPGRDGDPQRRRPDIGRMFRRYGWRPQVDLVDGLTRTVAWYEEIASHERPTPADRDRSRPRIEVVAPTA